MFCKYVDVPASKLLLAHGLRVVVPITLLRVEHLEGDVKHLMRRRGEVRLQGSEDGRGEMIHF